MDWACMTAGVSKATVYRRIRLDAEFERDFEIARLHGDIERAKVKIRRLRGMKTRRRKR